MTSTGFASSCPPVASFSSRSLSGWRSVCAGCSVIPSTRSRSGGRRKRAGQRLLLGRCLAGGRPFDRSLGALLGQQFHGLFAGEFLEGGGTRNRDVGDAVGDV